MSRNVLETEFKLKAGKIVNALITVDSVYRAKNWLADSAEAETIYTKV